MTHYYRGEKYIRLLGQPGKHRVKDTEECRKCGQRFLSRWMRKHMDAYHRPKGA